MVILNIGMFGINRRGKSMPTKKYVLSSLKNASKCDFLMKNLKKDLKPTWTSTWWVMTYTILRVLIFSTTFIKSSKLKNASKCDFLMKNLKKSLKRPGRIARSVQICPNSIGFYCRPKLTICKKPESISSFPS